MRDNHVDATISYYVRVVLWVIPVRDAHAHCRVRGSP
jgi:hypothetical protein